MKILWNYFRMIELSITDSAKKKLVKSDILGLRYKQFSGGGVKKIFFQKRKKYDFFNFWNLDVSKMDWNNGFNSSFFVGFPNNPNLDVSGHFGCKFFFWWLPLSAKAVSIYRLTGSRELIEDFPKYHINQFIWALEGGESDVLWYSLSYIVISFSLLEFVPNAKMFFYRCPVWRRRK